MSDNNNEIFKTYDYHELQEWFHSKFPKYKGWLEFGEFSIKLEVTYPLGYFCKRYSLDTCRIKFLVKCDAIEYKYRDILQRGQYQASSVTEEKIQKRIDLIKQRVTEAIQKKNEEVETAKHLLSRATQCAAEIMQGYGDCKVTPYGSDYMVSFLGNKLFVFSMGKNGIETIKMSISGNVEFMQPFIEKKAIQIIEK